MKMQILNQWERQILIFCKEVCFIQGVVSFEMTKLKITAGKPKAAANSVGRHFKIKYDEIYSKRGTLYEV